MHGVGSSALHPTACTPMTSLPSRVAGVCNWPMPNLSVEVVLRLFCHMLGLDIVYGVKHRATRCGARGYTGACGCIFQLKSSVVESTLLLMS